MKLAVVGSTGPWSNFEEAEVREFIRITYEILTPSIIVSGGAPGVDTWAEEQAVKSGITTVIFKPENKRWEPDGYKFRNHQIANECDWLVCLRTANSKTYGSGWTADEAQRLDKIVRRFTW